MKNKYLYITREYDDVNDWRPVIRWYYSDLSRAIEDIEKGYTNSNKDIELWGYSDINTLTIAIIELNNKNSIINEYKLYDKPTTNYGEYLFKQQSEWDRLREENPDGK